jgi:hypothetical protein
MFRRTSLSGSAFDLTQNCRSLRDRERFIESLLCSGSRVNGRTNLPPGQPATLCVAWPMLCIGWPRTVRCLANALHWLA